MHVSRRTLEADLVGMSPIPTAAYPSETDPPQGARFPRGRAIRTANKKEAAHREVRHIEPEAQDNRPTSERAKHNEIRSIPVDTYGDTRARLVVGAVEAMWRKRDLDDDEYGAAERWYRDYATGVAGGRDPVEGRSSGRADAHDAQIARIDALSRCLAARAVIGFCGEVRLKAVVFDQVTLTAAAERIFPGKSDGPRKLQAQIKLLLEQLVEHYRSVDRERAQRRRLTERTEPT